MSIDTAVIPAAGLGTRMAPATRALPKVMLPLGGKPVVQHVIDAAGDAKVDEILLVLGHDAERIQGSIRLPVNAHRSLRSA